MKSEKLAPQVDKENLDKAEKLFQLAVYGVRNPIKSNEKMRRENLTKRLIKDGLSKHQAESEKEKNEKDLVKPYFEKIISYLKEASALGNKKASYCLFQDLAYVTDSFLSDKETVKAFFHKANDYHEIEIAEEIKLDMSPSQVNDVIEFLYVWRQSISLSSAHASNSSFTTIDFTQAKEQLLKITSYYPIKSEKAFVYDTENKIIVEAKLVWASDFLTGNMNSTDEQESVNITESVCLSIKNECYKFLSKIENLSLLDLKEVEIRAFSFYYQSFETVFKILNKFIHRNNISICEETYNHAIILYSNLSSIENIQKNYCYAYQDYGLSSNVELELRKKYPKLTRHNPDGIRTPVKTHIIVFENVIEWYCKQNKSLSLYEEKFEDIIVKYNSIEEVLASTEILRFKESISTAYISKVLDMFNYCLLLVLNNQFEQAVLDFDNNFKRLQVLSPDSDEHTASLYESSIDIFKKYNVDGSYQSFQSETLEQIKKDDPLYIHINKIQNTPLNQEMFEKYILDNKFTMNIIHSSKDEYVFTYILSYINTLLVGGDFLNCTISKNRERAIELFQILADEALDSDKTFILRDMRDKTVGWYIEVLLSYISFNNKDELGALSKYYKGLADCRLNKHEQSDFKFLIKTFYPDNNILHSFTKFLYDNFLMVDNLNFYFSVSQDSSKFEMSDEEGRSKSIIDYERFKNEDYEHHYNEDYQDNNYQAFLHECQCYDEQSYIREVYPSSINARVDFIKVVKSINDTLQDDNPINSWAKFRLLMNVDDWRNHNSPIISYLSSNHFKNDLEASDIPFDLSKCYDSNILEIVDAVKNNDINIEYSKAIEIDSLNCSLESIETWLASATDGYIKIPEMLAIRTLLYLDRTKGRVLNDKSTSQLLNGFRAKGNEIEEPLLKLLNSLCEKYLSIELTPYSIFKLDKDISNKHILHPCLDILKNSSEYGFKAKEIYSLVNDNHIKLHSREDAGIYKFYKKALVYINYLTEKNKDERYVFSCHKKLIDAFLPLKYQLENELHIFKEKELAAKESELKLQQATQDAAIEKEREMLSFLTHTLRNSLADGPTQLERSIRLLGTDDYNDNKKYKAINSIASQLSTFSFVNTLISTFKQYVGDQERFNRDWFEDIEGEADIEWVISSCLKQCIGRALFFPNYQRVVKRLINTQNNSEVKVVRKEYLDNVLSESDENKLTETLMPWIHTNLAKVKIKIIENDSEFSINGTKSTYLFSIFSEVIWNAFKNIDSESDIVINFESIDNQYLLTIENSFAEGEINVESSTNKGLVFVGRLLSMFEGTELVSGISSGNLFRVKITLPQRLFDK